MLCFSWRSIYHRENQLLRVKKHKWHSISIDNPELTSNDWACLPFTDLYKEKQNYITDIILLDLKATKLIMILLEGIWGIVV